VSEITLCDAIKSLEAKYQLTPYQRQKCDEYFSLLKEGDYVYAGYLQSKIASSIKTAYGILEDLKNRGYLSYLFEEYCFNCNKSTGLFLESLVEFNPDHCCDFCNKQLTIDENIIILYKVENICMIDQKK